MSGLLYLCGASKSVVCSSVISAIRRRISYVVVIALVTLLTGISATASDDWQLVYSDDFERSEPGDNWSCPAGSMSIVDGALEVRSSGVGRAILNASYPADVKVSYTAWTPAGVQRCDLTTYLNTDSAGESSGYFMGYGSWMDSMNHIIKDESQELQVTRDYLIQANDKRHQIVAVKDGQRVSLTVDGIKVLDVNDPDPCGGDGEDHIGFYTWCSAMRIDNLRIYVKGTPPYMPEDKDLVLPLTIKDDGTLVLDNSKAPADIDRAVKLYNTRKYTDAYKALEKSPDTLLKALVLACVVGHPDFMDDRNGFASLLSCLNHLPNAEKNISQAKALSFLTRGLAVLSGAVEGNRSHYVPRLMATLKPGHPFYDKVQLYQARTFAWQYMESIKPRPWERSDAILKPLSEKYPNNRIIRMYLGESVPWEYNVSLEDKGDPVWAKNLCESYLRALAVIEWWGKNRQSAEGSVGGGWGDDVELLRSWGPVVMVGEGSEPARGVVKRMADGVWKSESIQETGFECFRSDVEHSAEPSADTQPLMMFIAYGDPTYVERNMVSAKLFRDKLMGRNSNGHWHWRSNQISSAGPSPESKYAVDVPYACRAFKHVLWLTWYSQNQAAVTMLHDWAKSWAEDTMRSANGKPAGVVPAVVGFHDDNLSGTSNKWWEPDLGWDYYNWNGGSWMYDIFAVAYYYTGDSSLLAPIRAALDFKPLAADTVPDWVTEKMRSNASSSAANALGTYRVLRGDESFADADKAKKDSYERFLEGGDRAPVLNMINSARQSMETNFEFLTSEVLYTDRAGIPCAENLLRTYCGTPVMWADSRVPAMSVSWICPTDKFAAVVTASTRQTLGAVLYSFNDAQMQAGARVFQLDPGVYALSVGSDDNDDWKMDSVDTVREVTILHKGDTFDFTLPSRKQTVVSLRMKKALRKLDGPLPDLAITSKDVTRKKGFVDVVVHNIGGKDAGAFKVSAIDTSSGRVISSRSVKSLRYPSDLTPKTAKIRLSLPARTGQLKIMVGYTGREITTVNNAVVVN